MNCRKTRKYFFQSGHLQDDIFANVQKHLAQCSECQEFSKEMGLMDEMLMAKLIDSPTDLHSSIMEAVGRAEEQAHTTDKIVPLSSGLTFKARFALGAGVAACLVAAGAWFMQPTDL